MERMQNSPQASLIVRYEAEIVRRARVVILSTAAFVVMMTAVTIGIVMLTTRLWPISFAVVASGYGLAFLLMRTCVRNAKRFDQFRILAFKWSKPRIAAGLGLTSLAMFLFGVALGHFGVVRQGTDDAGLVAGSAFLPLILGFFVLISSHSPERLGVPYSYAELEKWICEHDRKSRERELVTCEKRLRMASLYWKLFGAIGVGFLTLGIVAMSGSDRFTVTVGSGWILAMAGINYYLVGLYRRRIPKMKQELSGP